MLYKRISTKTPEIDQLKYDPEQECQECGMTTLWRWMACGWWYCCFCDCWWTVRPRDKDEEENLVHYLYASQATDSRVGGIIIGITSSLF